MEKDGKGWGIMEKVEQRVEKGWNSAPGKRVEKKRYEIANARVCVGSGVQPPIFWGG